MPVRLLSAVACLVSLVSVAVAQPAAPAGESTADLVIPKIDGVTPRNVVFVLSDDHRYDAMGHMGHPFLETPHMDRMAAGGINFTAGYVTTSLCSPSRASILTGQYAHTHRVVDNQNLVPEGTIFFPQYLQAAGYETAFFGKWHMGGSSDAPRPGFDRWVSFRGQGHYEPHPSGLNVDGERVERKGHITDEITDYCIDWINGRTDDKPFFVYLSHKAVHAQFTPCERHKGRYADAEVPTPKTQPDTPENFADKPKWVKDQRNSWHGVDFAYHSGIDIKKFYRDYCETLLGVDDSLGRVMDTLESKGWLDDTLIIYMGDNGFCFGEHGLIDKRHAYEASMRVPFMAHCPSLFEGGQSIDKVVANIDIAPTVLHAAGLQTPPQMQGRSFLDVMTGTEEDWRDSLLYEYYWERNFPHTPTMHAIRTDRWKFIRYVGVWDTEELYDMKNDPLEEHNLINTAEHQDLIKELKNKMFTKLEQTGGMQIPLNRDRGRSQNLRLRGRAPAGEFPDWFYRDEPVNRTAK